jgi:hypothetical protein
MLNWLKNELPDGEWFGFSNKAPDFLFVSQA